MSKRPLAFRHLSRLHELVSSASICRTVVARKLADDPSLARGAEEDGSMDEEIMTLARERGWSLPEFGDYEWQLMADFSDVMPRVLRILKRDVFELDGMSRETDDDDVSALASQLRNARRTLCREIEQRDPTLALPGAK